MKEREMSFKNPKTESYLLQRIKSQFNWRTAYKGRIQKYPNSSHYHLYSLDTSLKGTAEITFIPKEKPKRAIVKLASNRTSKWSLQTYNQLIAFLYET